ncbi:flagellin [Novosphingobium sp. P6W]|uniref:flagellin N-terminal helical domain-containing protein n=1 Tax=Novosphingobium sp. P6W TaxID=1609758 RepID=UPI0005C30DDD|nr:flagellin [Novosphingobium sp. P6W]KIS29522.1 hypothetical protein TQ38_27740 [Novosphingobium sp. P6W]
MATRQNRISTGLAVASTKDDSAKYIRAQDLRGQILMQQSVGDTLNRWKSTTDVAISGAETISDLMNRLQEKALALQGAANDPASMRAISKDIDALIKQIDGVVDASTFSGTNLLKGKGVTETVTRTSYSLPASSVNPNRLLASLSASQEAGAMPPGSLETVVSGSRRLTLPTSPLTPQSFDDLINPFSPADPNYLPVTNNSARTYSVAAGPTPGRVNLLIDTGATQFNGSIGNGEVEIWQNGVRVAASGQAYAADGCSVAPALSQDGPFVLSFDYDPAKGTDIQIRVLQGNANLAIEGLQLQDPAEAVPEPREHWNSAVAYETRAPFDHPVAHADPEQVTAARHDPLGQSALPEGVRAQFSLDPGDAAAHIDLSFDAYELPDTMEIWQDGIRLAATGQPAASQGAAAGAGQPVSGLHMLSFDYDPAKGPLAITVNGEQYDARSAWAIGAVSMREVGALPASGADKVVTGLQRPTFADVPYDFIANIHGGSERIMSRDLSARTLDLDPLDWDDPEGIVDKIQGASRKVLAALTYFGAHSRGLDTHQADGSRQIDIKTQALGNLVDADLSVEAARSEALRMREQLALQALSIANQQPALILRLFGQ